MNRSAMPPFADGILDRLVHNAHRVELRSESGKAWLCLQNQ
jgi:hypothetical protein